MNSNSSQLHVVDESTQIEEQELKNATPKGILFSNVFLVVLLVTSMIVGYGVYFQDVNKLEITSSPSSSSSSSSTRRHLLGFIDNYIGLQHPELSHPNLRYELQNLASHRGDNRKILKMNETPALKQEAASSEIFGQDEVVRWEV